MNFLLLVKAMIELQKSDQQIEQLINTREEYEELISEYIEEEIND